MVLEKDSLTLLRQALDVLENSFDDLPQFKPETDLEAWQSVLLQVAKRMQDNYPYPHPFYAGQMLKPPHPIARLAYMLSLWINPNNHALDGGRASSAMEKEAVAEIAAMFGWETHLGHLTSGGTMANLEGLWIAGLLKPDMKVVASQQAHYTHSRISGVLKLRYKSVPTDARGRMDMGALEDNLQGGDVGTVVVTLGTTSTGSVDPLAEILALREKYTFRVHVDAAYGGYFTLIDDLDADTRAAYDHLHHADSIAIDPHKHGLQPYGCGCILFNDPDVGAFYKHDSPYTYFTSDDLHLGEISLECSRAGASAVALWATQKLLPLQRGGTFAQELSKTRQSAHALYERIQDDERFIAPFAPELDILIFAPHAEKASSISRLSQQIFDEAARLNLHLAITRLPARFFSHIEGITWDVDEVVCLRSVLMKPEHLDWVDEIWWVLEQATVNVLQGVSAE